MDQQRPHSSTVDKHTTVFRGNGRDAVGRGSAYNNVVGGARVAGNPEPCGQAPLHEVSRIQLLHRYAPSIGRAPLQMGIHLRSGRVRKDEDLVTIAPVKQSCKLVRSRHAWPVVLG